mmetsp:Transcript_2295/g.5472  ORF Transcript_2295/g.5472 Transcript_2295/m.5472 type:complete len:226 (-) Transcript_2295:112-789(-)
MLALLWQDVGRVRGAIRRLRLYRRCISSGMRGICLLCAVGATSAHHGCRVGSDDGARSVAVAVRTGPESSHDARWHLRAHDARSATATVQCWHASCRQRVRLPAAASGVSDAGRSAWVRFGSTGHGSTAAVQSSTTPVQSAVQSATDTVQSEPIAVQSAATARAASDDIKSTMVGSCEGNARTFCGGGGGGGDTAGENGDVTGSTHACTPHASGVKARCRRTTWP